MESHKKYRLSVSLSLDASGISGTDWETLCTGPQQWTNLWFDCYKDRYALQSMNDKRLHSYWEGNFSGAILNFGGGKPPNWKPYHIYCWGGGGAPAMIRSSNHVSTLIVTQSCRRTPPQLKQMDGKPDTPACPPCTPAQEWHCPGTAPHSGWPTALCLAGLYPSV